MIKESYIILIVIFWIFNQLTIGNVLQSLKFDHYLDYQVDQHIQYRPKIIIDPKYPQCKITCKSSFCEVTRGEMQEEVTGSCFFPPYKTSCAGLPPGCESCVEACGFKDSTKIILPHLNLPTIPLSPITHHHFKEEQCKITCKWGFCEVTRGQMQDQFTGYCFLPPYQTECSLLPSGCESCVEACGFKDNTKKPSTTHNPFIPSMVSGKKKIDSTDQAMENPDIQVGHFRRVRRNVR